MKNDRPIRCHARPSDGGEPRHHDPHQVRQAQEAAGRIPTRNDGDGATTTDGRNFTDDESAFLLAVDRWRHDHPGKFLGATGYLRLLKEMGYEKVR